MRTTVTLENDVAARLKSLAHQRRTSFKAIVNAVLRRGLAAQERSDADTRAPFQIQTFRSELRPGVDPLKLNQLLDQLEAQEHGQPSR